MTECKRLIAIPVSDQVQVIARVSLPTLLSLSNCQKTRYFVNKNIFMFEAKINEL
jgi:hypothetical protein